MTKILAITFVIAIGLVLAYTATRPDIFRCERSVLIDAPPDKIYALIEDLHRFNSWNPYEKKDPNIKGSYSGPSSGPGATYAFDGNREVGKGRISIVSTTAPTLVAMQLEMIEPMAGSNSIEFTLVPQADAAKAATKVTWAMHGPSPFIAKLAGVFLNMDRMIGRDFESGLASLKSLAERS